MVKVCVGAVFSGVCKTCREAKEQAEEELAALEDELEDEEEDENCCR